VRRLGMATVGALVLALAGLGDPSAAAAGDDGVCDFGSHQRLVDAGGAVVQDWTVTDLKKSTDLAPGYPLAGQLWEATASVQALSGPVTPIIPNLAVSAAEGGTYPVLWQLASPQSLSGATIAPGQTSTGKVYFDVTGADPAMVTYTGSGAQRLMWCSCAAMMAMPMKGMPTG
jgi:hypothetical protein